MFKRIVSLGIVLIMVFSLTACGDTYHPEKDEHATIISTDFFKVQLYETLSFARIYGLTELGMQQEILAIPAYIEGYPVTQIGIRTNVFSFKKTKIYGIESDKLKKIYIPYTIVSKLGDGLPIESESITCKEEVVILAVDGINMRGVIKGDARVITNNGVVKNYDFDNNSGQYLSNIKYAIANVYYDYNYEDAPNFGCYWSDYITGENLYLSPEDPLREGYIFTGWYLEFECKTEWNGVLPSSEDDKLGLYAGWVTNQ